MANSLGTLTLNLVATIGGFTGPLNQAERNAGRAMGGISTAAKAAATAVIALGAATLALGGSKIVEVQRQFDTLNAGLVTATGSTEKAGQAFLVLQDFAASTPYSLSQAVEGFTKLVNLGLTPSERALQSYGNTASAMGKDLMQMVEAVADASTGEFERLKEFGIKASAQGDKVALSFQGTTTTVKNSAAAIEEYLIKLGEDKFGDAMALRAKTLDGAISNLGDNWDNLFLTISKSGVGDAVAAAVAAAGDAISYLSDQLKSGEIPTLLGGLGDAFSLFSDDAVGDIKSVLSAFGSLVGAMGITRDSVIEDLNAMGNEWNDFKTVVQKSAVFVAATAETLRTGKDQRDMLGQQLDILDEQNASRQDALKKANELAKIEKILFDMGKSDKKDKLDLGQFKKGGDDAGKADADKANKKAKSELDKAQSQFKSLQDMAATETEKANKQLDERLKLIGRFADKGSAEYTRLANWANSENKRVLLEEEISHESAVNEFRDMVGTRIEIMKREASIRTKGIFTNTILSKDEKKDAVKNLAEFYQNKQDLMELSDRKELDGFLENNRTELENIRKRYEFERAQIKLNLDFSDAEKAVRIGGISDQQMNETNRLQQGATSSFFGLSAELSGDSENMQLSNQKEERYKIIQDALDAEAIQQEQANALRLKVDQDYASASQELQLSRAGAILDSTTQMFGQMFGEQSSAYKIMFASSKAFAIAQSIIAIQAAMASSAMSLPFPANLGAIAIVAAQTASIVSTISSTVMGQAHDGIDYVPKEGTWLLDKGERVLSPRQNADFTQMMKNDSSRMSMSSNQMQQVQPQSNSVSMQNKIINLIDPNLLGDFMKTAQGEKILVNTIGRAKGEINQVLR